LSGNATTDTFTYNAIGQITTTGYKYDGTGNLIATPTGTFTYNGAQQMTASVKDGVKTSYTYAGASMVKMLAQVTDGGQAYQYTYGKSGALTARSVAGTGTASVLSDPSGGQPLDLRATEGSTSMWSSTASGTPPPRSPIRGRRPTSFRTHRTVKRP
jgi:YD repeat-containing protein